MGRDIMAGQITKPPGWLNEIDPHDFINVKEGWVDRRIYSDPEIYKMELERIFGRCWNFLAHESQIPGEGDFITTMVGQDQVIVVRGEENKIHAFLNSCSHRGNRVCMANSGNTRNFTCNYHGWTFALDGTLSGVPSQKLYQQPSSNYDPTELGLVTVAHIESYKGLVFGTFDETAPTLTDFLGDFAWYLDIVLDNDEGGTEFLDGCFKYDIACNWKVPADNFTGDSYHAVWTHASAAKALFGHPVRGKGLENTYQATMNGHGWGVGLDMVGNAYATGSRVIVEYWKAEEQKIAERLGKLRSKMVAASCSANVFPNFGFLPGHSVFRTWIPTGPAKMELRTWTLVNKNMPEEVKEAYRKSSAFTFSPGGVFEMDDTENWESAARANQGFVTNRQKLHYGLGSNSEIIEDSDLPGTVRRNMFNDSNQLAFYERWADLLAAESWADVPDRTAV